MLCVFAGADKPTSPRLTLRFQSIKSRDEHRSSCGSSVADITPPHHPKYQSYCVTMETKGGSSHRQEDATVSSTQSDSDHPTHEAAVTSTSEEEQQQHR